MKLYWTDAVNFIEKLIQTSSSPSFKSAFITTMTEPVANAADEQAYFDADILQRYEEVKYRPLYDLPTHILDFRTTLQRSWKTT